MPIKFEKTMFIQKSSEEICAEIADVTQWRNFDGYLFLPGIKKAEYKLRTAEMIGSCISVQNTDGSQHTEEICVWNPKKNVVLKFSDFSPPLNNLATHFIEEWQFRVKENGTEVRRKFELFPKNSLTRPALWLISLILRRAVARHLDKISRN